MSNTFHIKINIVFPNTNIVLHFHCYKSLDPTCGAEGPLVCIHFEMTVARIHWKKIGNQIFIYLDDS